MAKTLHERHGFPSGFVEVTTFNRPPENGHRKIPEVPELDKLLWAIDHVQVGPFALRGEEYLNSRWKRAFDVAFAIGGLLALAPIMAGAMAAMKLENPKLPTLRVQARYGKGWKLFPMLKIRSQDIETVGTGQIHPTRRGGVLRRFRLDEIPQLINVFKGEMDLVGPRPPITQDLARFEEWARIHGPYETVKKIYGFTDEEWKEGRVTPMVRELAERHADKLRVVSTAVWEKWRSGDLGRPGITGLYPLLGGRDLNHSQRTKIDLLYREKASLLLDFLIALKTPQAMASGRGAR